MVSPEKSQHDDINTVADLIEHIKVAMMTTVRPDGTLHSRPMASQTTQRFNGALWFIASVTSHATTEIEHDQRVSVSFADPDDQTYVAVSGRARVIRDRAKVRELWSPFHLAWFPAGPDDPDITLIRVVVEVVEYWKGASAPAVRMAGFVKALVTGEKFEAGENRRIAMGTAAARDAL